MIERSFIKHRTFRKGGNCDGEAPVLEILRMISIPVVCREYSRRILSLADSAPYIWSELCFYVSLHPLNNYYRQHSSRWWICQFPSVCHCCNMRIIWQLIDKISFQSIVNLYQLIYSRSWHFALSNEFINLSYISYLVSLSRSPFRINH